jgi:hypothetical protein
MRDHDLELIAALVEGRLEDETEARALIASSPEAREEYEAQKLAFESLRSMGVASLTEEERAALHRDVWTELRTETQAKRTMPWYYRWVPVAAGLFVIIGLVTVLSGGGQEVAETSNDIASGLRDGEGGAAPTTTAAGATFLDSGQDDAGAESAPTETTEEMSETTFAAETQSDESAAAFEDEATRVRERAFTARLQDYDEEAEDADVEACLQQADLINYQPVATLTRPDPATSNLEETIVVAAPERSDIADAPLAFVDLDTCEVVYLDDGPG